MRIAVLYGGTSAERDVSLVSGRHVGLALVERGHEVLLVDPAGGDSPVGASEAAAAAAIDSDPPAIRHETGSAIAAIQG
ncbi:D-alanine--D-alanine ligase, partial [bacterium]|nr:D-alanine--D-alanine ligase [bacterium]